MGSNLENALTRIAAIQRRFETRPAPPRVDAATGGQRQTNVRREGSPVPAPNPSFNTLLAQQLQQQAAIASLASIGGGGFGDSRFNTSDPFASALGLGGSGGLAGLGGLGGLAGLGLGSTALTGVPGALPFGLGATLPYGSGAIPGLGGLGLNVASYRYNPFRELDVSSPFGDRPVAGDPDVTQFHGGTDYVVSEGTPLPAFGSGIVTAVDHQSDGPLGRSVTYRLDTGEVVTYGHLTDQAPMSVVVGQRVGPGQIVGISGNTGVSTGPHVHVEIRLNGEPVDPHQYLSLLP